MDHSEHEPLGRQPRVDSSSRDRLRRLDEGSLPNPRSSLVGRREELAALRSVVEHGAPLVSIIGTGGSGKTRVALELGRLLHDAFAGRVWFVSLVAVTDPDDVPPTIAGALRVRASAERSVSEAVADELRHGPGLLVLDNFEQVLAAAPFVAYLVDACPQLSVVVTSRAALRLAAETVYDLPPLSVDGPQGDAVELFCLRAQASNPAFDLRGHEDAVVKICRRLDGLPLAIELAASRSSLLTPPDLLQRLDRHVGGGAMRLLTGGAADLPTRHRTLADTIAWSYDLLDEPTRALFRALAVFEGGWTLAAAERIVDPAGTDHVLDRLTALVDLRLVIVEHAADQGGETRFRLLETIREFAELRLAEDADAIAALRGRHCGYYADLAEAARDGLESPDDGRWIARLEADYTNLRAAFAELERRGELARALRAGTALGWFWRHSGRGEEARQRLRAWYDRAAPTLDARTEADACVMIGRLSADSGLVGEGREGAEDSIALLERGLAASRTFGEPVRLLRAIESLVVALAQHERGTRAVELCAEGLALSEQIGHWWWHAMFRYSEVINGQGRGDLDAALRAAELGTGVAQAHDDPRLAAIGILLMGTSHLMASRFDEALVVLADAYRLSMAEGDKRNASFAAASMGASCWAVRRLEESATWTREALLLAQAVSEWRCIGFGLTSAFLATYSARDLPASAVLFGAMRNDFNAFYRAMPEVEQQRVLQLVGKVRDTLGEDRFEKLDAIGMLLPRHLAIEEAIGAVEAIGAGRPGARRAGSILSVVAPDAAAPAVRVRATAGPARFDHAVLGRELGRTVKDTTLQLLPTVGSAVHAGVDGARARLSLHIGGDEVVVDYDRSAVHDASFVEAAAQVVLLTLERERLAEELAAREAAARAERQRLLDQLDAERRRLAQDLHDGVQAQLVTAALQVGELLAAEPAGGGERLASAAAGVRAQIDRAIAELRGVVDAVAPPLLARRGLVAAVEDLLDRVPLRTALRVEGVEAVDPAVERAAYFVVAECLTNVMKHARASTVSLTLALVEGELSVEVVDDGVGGVDLAGRGLQGMAARVDVFGGRLDVHSPPLGPTAVVARLPVAVHRMGGADQSVDPRRPGS